MSTCVKSPPRCLRCGRFIAVLGVSCRSCGVVPASVEERERLLRLHAEQEGYRQDEGRDPLAEAGVSPFDPDAGPWGVLQSEVVRL